MSKKIPKKNKKKIISPGWKVAPKAPDKFFKDFPQYSEIMLQLLYNRGIKTEGEIDTFLNPDYSKLFDPFKMLGMKEASERIWKAIAKKEKIGIYGDYDVDGLTSSALLYKVLKYLGAEAEVYIPCRIEEGYSLNKDALKTLLKKKIRLLLTVDCGSSNFSEIEFAKKNGLEIIVTDHHEVPEKLPKTIVINPKQKNCSYPFKGLAGVGVTFKLAQALFSANNKQTINDRAFLKWQLDLVSLGTIADMVPLVSENRILAKWGLIVLGKTKNFGLRALLAKAGVHPDHINSQDITFTLAPYLNAASRMEHGQLAFNILIEDSFEKAEDLAEKLKKLNQDRQKITRKIIKEAKEEVNHNDKFLVVSSPNWSLGLAGLLASRLVEEYQRPACVLVDQGGANGKTFKGSVRSFGGISLMDIFKSLDKHILKYGGHDKAAGIEIEKKSLEEFIKKLNKKLSKVDLSNITEKILIDYKIDTSQISWNLWEEIKYFEPFGKGNSLPTFLLENINYYDAKLIGKDKNHLKLNITDTALGEGFSALGFGMGNLLSDLDTDNLNLVFNIIADSWKGQKKIKLKIVDIK